MALTSLLGGLRKKRTGVVQAMNGVSPAFTAQNQTPGYSLPPNFGFSDLAGYEEARRKEFGNTAEQAILNRRASLATSLGEEGKKRFEMNNPYILEDLNSRGLLTSPTAVSDSQANALKEIELSNQSRLSEFDNAALSAKLQAEQDALDSGLDLRRGELEQRFGDAASNREEGLARDLARQQKRQGITQSLIGASGGILGGLLARGGGGFLGLGGGATGASVGGSAGASAPVAGAGVGSALPLALLAAGGIAGYKALPDKGIVSKNTVAPLVNPLQTTSAIGKAVKKLCFDAMTPVEMSDGSYKPICELDLDDETRGGRVESIRISKTASGTLFNYLGVNVTGSHAVKENGRWVRIENSLYGVPIKGSCEVFSIVTTNHRIYSEGTIFADEHETDQYEDLNLEESLAKMNYDDSLVGVN